MSKFKTLKIHNKTTNPTDFKPETQNLKTQKKAQNLNFMPFQIYFKFILKKSAVPAIGSRNFPRFIKFLNIVYKIIKNNCVLRNRFIFNHLFKIN